MKTIMQKINKKQVALLFILASPLISLAQSSQSAAEEAAENARTAMYSEIGIGIFFVVTVAALLVYKKKHDKKVREQQMRQMEKIQAAKRRKAA